MKNWYRENIHQTIKWVTVGLDALHTEVIEVMHMEWHLSSGWHTLVNCLSNCYSEHVQFLNVTCIVIITVIAVMNSLTV